MKKKLRIRKRKDFIRISKSGVYAKSDFVIVQCDINNLNHFRVGITATKRIGNAVARNRCKRRLRAAADIVLYEMGINAIDYVFIAKKSLLIVNWITLLDAIRLAIISVNKKIQQCRNLC